LAVGRKYVLARPPRSAVGSPSLADTSPLRSSRSSVMYTLPTDTLRPEVASISSEIGTP
jgi:hypothetical protein